MLEPDFGGYRLRSLPGSIMAGGPHKETAPKTPWVDIENETLDLTPKQIGSDPVDLIPHCGSGAPMAAAGAPLNKHSMENSLDLTPMSDA